MVLALATCGGDRSDGEQAADVTEIVAETTVDDEVPTSDDEAAATTTSASSSTSVLSVTTESTSTSTSSTTSASAQATPCSSSSIAGDLGAGSTVVDGACESGWAVVDICDDEPCGDSWVLASHQGGAWSIVTGFPTGLCRSDLSAQGAPDRVLDVVNWPPCNAAATSTSTPPPEPVDTEGILDVFIAAWNAGDWATMSSVAEPAVVEVARAAAVPGGSVLPAPARGRCFFGFPNTTCEVAYGSGGTGTLYKLTVADRIATMEPSG